MATYIDTSALAKWYLNEPRSDEFEAYLLNADEPTISSLTIVETRSLLARHRRMGQIEAETEQRAFARFQRDIDARFVDLLQVDHSHLLAAAHLLDRLNDHPLRTLDAIHLALCETSELTDLATADAVMATAAAELGISVARFD